MPTFRGYSRLLQLGGIEREITPVPKDITKEDLQKEIDALNAKATTEVVEASGTELSAEAGKYYRFDDAVETLAVTLPLITDDSEVSAIALFLTGGTTPAVTFTATAPEGGTAPDIYYEGNFDIASGKSYEVNCLWNGLAWVIIFAEVATT